MNRKQKNGMFLLIMGIAFLILLAVFQFRKIQSLQWEAQFAAINSVVTDTYMANTKQGTVERNRYKLKISYSFRGKDYTAELITGRLSNRYSVKIRINPNKPEAIILEPSWLLAIIFALFSLLFISSGLFEIIKHK